MKMCPVETKFFHVDRWADMKKVTVTFCKFSNVPIITPFRTIAGRKIAKQPTLVTVQGTVYQNCPVLTGNYTLFLTENFLLCGVINYIPSSLQWHYHWYSKNPLLSAVNSVYTSRFATNSEKMLQEPCKISDVALGKKTMCTTQNMIVPQDEKCRTSVNKAEYLRLYPWVQKMKVWYESRHHHLVHIWTMSKVFWPEPSSWHADYHKIHTLVASSWQKPTLWYSVSGSSGTHNQHVFFACQYCKLALEGSIFDDTTIQE
jgi:hypothetical protein